MIRRLLVAIALALLLPVAAHATCDTDAYSHVVCADSPYSYWRMDTNSNTQTDVGSQNVNLNCGGSVLSKQQPSLIIGISNFSAHFDSGNSLNCGEAAGQSIVWGPLLANGSGWTWEGWFKLDGVGVTERIGDGFAGSGQREWKLSSVSGVVSLIIYQGDGASTYGTGNFATVTAGSTHYYAFTSLGAGSNHLAHLNTYFDGALVSNVTSFTGSAWQFGVTAFVGSSAGGTEALVGYADEVAIYQTELSAARIQAHYIAGIGGLHGSFFFITKADDILDWFLKRRGDDERHALSRGTIVD